MSLKKEKDELELATVNLWKDLDDTRVAKDLALQRDTKADEVSNCLGEELEAERESAVSLRG
jgi:hypothetical protein